jgi:hypothetical protein
MAGIVADPETNRLVGAHGRDAGELQRGRDGEQGLAGAVVDRERGSRLLSARRADGLHLGP